RQRDRGNPRLKRGSAKHPGGSFITTTRQVARTPWFCSVSSSCVSRTGESHRGMMEGGSLPYHWPADTDFALWELDVLDRACPACGRMMYICDHRYRHLHTLDG